MNCRVIQTGTNHTWHLKHPAGNKNILVFHHDDVHVDQYGFLHVYVNEGPKTMELNEASHRQQEFQMLIQ